MSEFLEKDLSLRAAQAVQEDVSDWIGGKSENKRSTIKVDLSDDFHRSTYAFRSVMRRCIKDVRGTSDEWVMRGSAFRLGKEIKESVFCSASEFLGAPLETMVQIIEENDIETLMRNADWILELEDNWDGEGSSGYSEQIFAKVKKLLTNWKSKFFDEFIRVFPLPEIHPGPEGCIDLYWKKEDYELLLTVSSEDEPIDFYGDDYRYNVMKGSFAEDSKLPSFLVWLYTVS